VFMYGYNTLGLRSVVSCACDFMFFSLVLFCQARIVYKCDFKLVLN
jgi:hypothetical protein